MELFCIPGPLYDFLFLLAIGGLCLFLGAGIVTAIIAASESSKNDHIVAQLRARGVRNRASVQQLTATHTEKMAQTAEELKRKRKTQ